MIAGRKHWRRGTKPLAARSTGRNFRRASLAGALADQDNAARPTRSVKPNGHRRSRRTLKQCHKPSAPLRQADSLDDARLTLQVKRSGSNRYRPMPLTVTEFIRRWLMHVLPAGLHRVRHYGFLNGSSKRSLEEVRLLVALANDLLHYLAGSDQAATPRPPKMVCPQCGGAMTCLGYTPPAVVASSTVILRSSRAPP